MKSPWIVVGMVALHAIWTGVAVAAPQPRPGIVGQIIGISGAAWVTHHGGPRSAAEPYEPLYRGDIVEVSGSGEAVVALPAAFGGEVHVTRAASPYRVAATSGQVNVAAFERVLAEWEWVFQPPRNNAIALEASQGLTPTPTQFFTPIGNQKLRSGRHQVLPVVWLGPHVAVKITQANQAPCPAASPAAEDQPEFVLVDCPALQPGTYHLKVGEALQTVQFDVVAGPAPEPSGSADEQALAAADALKNQPERRLQALADLQRLSPHSWLASAIMDRVRTSP